MKIQKIVKSKLERKCRNHKNQIDHRNRSNLGFGLSLTKVLHQGMSHSFTTDDSCTETWERKLSKVWSRDPNGFIFAVFCEKTAYFIHENFNYRSMTNLYDSFWTDVQSLSLSVVKK